MLKCPLVYRKDAFGLRRRCVSVRAPGPAQTFVSCLFCYFLIGSSSQCGYRVRVRVTNNLFFTPDTSAAQIMANADGGEAANATVREVCLSIQ